MRRRSLTQLIFAVPAVCMAFAVPASAQQAPTWGWKPEDVAHYKEFWKPKKPPARTAWSVDVVGAPAAPTAPAAESKPAAQKSSEAKPATPAETPPAIKAYCQNIEDPALDARFLHQKAELQHLEGELEKRTSALEAKRAEYQEWLQRRDEFLNKVKDELVTLYSKVKPDAAATQLERIDDEEGAALLLRFTEKHEITENGETKVKDKSRVAAGILNQMDAPKAARLLSVMLGAAKLPEKAVASECPPAPEKGSTPEAGLVSSGSTPEAGLVSSTSDAPPLALGGRGQRRDAVRPRIEALHDPLDGATPEARPASPCGGKEQAVQQAQPAEKKL